MLLLISLFSIFNLGLKMTIMRVYSGGGGGGGVDRVSGPPENHKKYRVFSNTGPDPL